MSTKPDAPVAMTPKQSGDRIVAIRTAITAIDAQAATIVAGLITARAALADLAAQRQPLVTEASAIVNDMMAAPWRDDLRASGDNSSP